MWPSTLNACSLANIWRCFPQGMYIHSHQDLVDILAGIKFHSLWSASNAWARGTMSSRKTCIHGRCFSYLYIYIYIIKKGSCPVPLPSTPQSPIQFQLGSWASHVWLYHDDFNHLFANQISSPSQYKLTKARDRWLLPLSPLAPAPSRPQWPLAPALVTARDSCFAAMSSSQHAWPLQWPYSVMEQGDWEWALRVWSEESHAYETEWVRYEDHEQMILKNLVCILCSSCIDNWSGG